MIIAFGQPDFSSIRTDLVRYRSGLYPPWSRKFAVALFPAERFARIFALSAGRIAGIFALSAGRLARIFASSVNPSPGRKEIR
jgi:hypothetical protein